MLRVTLSKIASAVKNVDIRRDAYVSDEVIAKPGYVVAVRILTEKAVYNQLENTEGRMMRLKPGDVVAGVLGRRRALRAYVGDVPAQLKVGDVLHVLNLGGVIGRCTSWAPDVGRPFDAELLGAVLHFPYLGERIGVPAFVGQEAIPESAEAADGPPVVAVVGTCMDAGKTVAACELIHGMCRRGKRVAAGKLTGVALQRDVLAMLDHGAQEALSFVDAGVPSTGPDNAPDAARRIIAQLDRTKPDVIVAELGDGLLGEYGVRAILSSPDLARRIRSTVLCASDPVGAWGGVKLLDEQFGLRPDVIAGSVSDNETGGSFIASSLGIPMANALSAPDRLVRQVWRKVFGDEPDDA